MIEKKSSQKFSTFHFVRNAEKQTALSQRTDKQINFECPQAQDNPPWLTILEASVNAHKNPQALKWKKKSPEPNFNTTQCKCSKYPFHKNIFFNGTFLNDHKNRQSKNFVTIGNPKILNFRTRKAVCTFPLPQTLSNPFKQIKVLWISTYWFSFERAISKFYVLGVGETSTLIPLSLLLERFFGFRLDAPLKSSWWLVPSVVTWSSGNWILLADFASLVFSLLLSDSSNSFFAEFSSSRNAGCWLSLWLDVGVDVRGFCASCEIRLTSWEGLILLVPSECSTISTPPGEIGLSFSLSFPLMLSTSPLLLDWSLCNRW